ncbi:hypothetical protein LXN57_32125 [Actinoplanes sp. TRM88002]|uniref:Tetratricopeptide repeat protein n=2 Tax=Paractinoplanes hotanensis TaxID=2906497 RepID=A0ABT0Y859_9ACTN|nr:hypothetical protein [Actinoplanes hotanensis]
MTRSETASTPRERASTDSGELELIAGLEPGTAGADADTVAAAVAFARNSRRDAQSRLAWARYAHHAAEQLFGQLHPVALQAGRVYQSVLAEHGHTLDAVTVARARLHVAEQAGDQVLALTSRCSYATALHRHGHCEQALRQARLCLQTWWASPHGFGHPATVLLSAAAIHAGCGRGSAAVNVLVDDAAHLRLLDPPSRRMAARWLALVATTHHGRCALPTLETASGRDDRLQQQFWLSVLETPHHHTRSTATKRLGGAIS